MNGSIISSSVGAAAFTAVSPVSGSDWENLGWSVLSAVLAAVLSWLSGKRPVTPSNK